jgi:hypothetical protein
MTIRHAVDDKRRTLLIVFSGTVTGPEFVAFGADLYGSRPELFDYACILDLLDYEGDVGYADLNPLQNMYEPPAEPETCQRPGFIVTLDPNFEFWAAALDHQFPGRKHYIVSSLAEAFSSLERLRRKQANDA